MSAEVPSPDNYSFQEGLLATITLDRDAGTAILKFNAVPLRRGHPDFNQARLTANRKKGLLYANEDVRNVDLQCSGCTFRTVSWDPEGKLRQSEKRFDLNNSVDKFQVTSSSNGTHALELEAEDIRLVISCSELGFSETKVES
jgi:hypothetical protein